MNATPRSKKEEAEPLLTYEEVAQEFQCSHWHIRRLVRRKKLKPVVLGIKTVRFTREELNRFKGVPKAA